MRKTFLERLASPVVLTGIIAQVVVILLLLGFDKEQVETWRLIAMAVLQIYATLFGLTNNPTIKGEY